MKSAVAPAACATTLAPNASAYSLIVGPIASPRVARDPGAERADAHRQRDEAHRPAERLARLVARDNPSVGLLGERTFGSEGRHRVTSYRDGRPSAAARRSRAGSDAD
jgi:hypothetical protein